MSLAFTSLFSSEYINYGAFKKDESLFLEKDISKLSEKFLNVKYVSHTLSNHEIDTLTLGGYDKTKTYPSRRLGTPSSTHSPFQMKQKALALPQQALILYQRNRE